MLDIFGMVAALNRPSLLVRTARFGVDEYKRSIHLPRILRSPSLPKCAEALVKLLELERRMNDHRLAARAEYSISKHVEVLIAIMAEARDLRAKAKPRSV